MPPNAGPSSALADPGAARAAASGSGTLGPDAALRAVLFAGYTLPCGSVPGQVLRALPDGYELSALGQAGTCRPPETRLYRLHVSNSGQITILDAVVVDPAQLRCDGGQPEIVPPATPLA